MDKQLTTAQLLARAEVLAIKRERKIEQRLVTIERKSRRREIERFMARM